MSCCSDLTNKLSSYLWLTTAFKFEFLEFANKIENNIVCHFLSNSVREMSAIKRKLDEDVVLPEKIHAFIVSNMEAFKCCTHDVAHCFRVANLSKVLAEAEPGADPKLAYIAGTMHDILDSKLLASDKVDSAANALVTLLREYPDFVTEEEIQHILTIIKSVGYKNVIKEDWNPMEMSVEYRCVQDADLLDAIGAIGVARTFAYTGKKNRPMFGVTKPVNNNISHKDYLATKDCATDSCVDHFFDKLLQIKRHITTAKGKALAEKRQKYMIQFLQEIDSEMGDCEDPTAKQIQIALVDSGFSS